ncbi:homing endonuclease associated repeat-containing protein [Natronorubrum sp. A-ect3]|uniref:homing endonuclease associated repeat-containing protein n=1 Tax=Natronorubrum sp. A-ect3 TaxID=3242698 RepID=UPI00359E9108
MLPLSTRPIDEIVDRAENAIDAGDKAHFEGDSNLAGQQYEAAVDALAEAKTLTTELAPDRVAEIDRQLRSVRVRQQSLELSGPHQTVRDLVAAAREHAAAGDRAFHDSEYEVALKEYESARDRYESLADSLHEFSFDECTTDPMVCDVCRQRFDAALDFWRINLGVSLQVCLACTRFGSDGNIPNPRAVATEQRAVVENIESIRDGNVGLDWTSDAPPQSDESEDVGTTGDSRDTRQILMQLVGLYQQLGEPPTAADLDEHTDFGYLAYRDEFGSLSEALQAAGFES